MEEERLQQIVAHWSAGKATSMELDELRQVLLAGKIPLPVNARVDGTGASVEERTIATEGGPYFEGKVDTRGGTLVAGPLHQSGGAFIGRDQIVSLGLDRAAAERLWEVLFPARRHTLRAPVADFSGRQVEMERLLAALAASKTAGRVAAIRGMGGVGKTELALIVAHRLASHYPDAQLLMSLQAGAAERLLGEVIHAFLPLAQLPDNLADLQGLYRQVLHGTRGLLLLDNAASAEQVRSLLPPPAGWAVIVTSRERFPLTGATLMDLDVLSEAEAVTLLQRLLADGGRADLAQVADDELEQLAQLCGMLPLALRLAAGFLTTYTNWTLKEYCQELQTERLTYLEVAGESVAGVLAVSVKRLAQANGDLARRWRLLAIFPAPFNREAAEAVWAVEDKEVRQALGALLQRSLLDYDPRTSTYSLHDLLRAYALDEPPPDLAEARTRHAWHFIEVGRQVESLYKQGWQGLQQFATVWPHLSVAWDWMYSQQDQEAKHWLLNFSLFMPEILALNLRPSTRIPVVQTALTIAREIGDRRGEAIAGASLAVAYHHRGEVREAIPYYEQALAIALKIGDRQGEAAALGQLGIAYHDVGMVQQAITYYEQVLAIAREIGSQRNEATALGQLGNAYCDVGEVQQAIMYYEQALAIIRKIGYRRGEAVTLSNLGNAYRRLGEVQKSVVFHEQTLAIAQEIGDRWVEGQALGSLGIAYHDLGEVQKAVMFYEQTLATAQEVGNRRGEAIASWNLGLVYNEQGDYEKAAGLMQVTVEYARALGHPDVEEHARHLEDVRNKASVT